LRREYELFCTQNGYYSVSTVELSRRLKDLGYRIKPKCTNNATWVFYTKPEHNAHNIEETNNQMYNFINKFKNEK